MKVSSIKRGLYFYLARSSVYQRTIAADNAAAARFSVGKRFEEEKEKGKKRWKFDFPPPEIGEKFFSSLFAGNYSPPRFDVAYLRFLPPRVKSPFSPRSFLPLAKFSRDSSENLARQLSSCKYFFLCRAKSDLEKRKERKKEKGRGEISALTKGGFFGIRFVDVLDVVHRPRSSRDERVLSKGGLPRFSKKGYRSCPR